MINYKVYKDPYDCEVLFTGKLDRTIEPGLTILTGCNGSGKTTTLMSIKDQLAKNENYRIFNWNGRYDKNMQKDKVMLADRYDLLASLSFCSEGEEISTNISILASEIGNFVRRNQDKNIIILLDGVDSGLSIDNIDEIKTFFKDIVIPDINKTGHECYIIAAANEYELVSGENCIDARSGKKISFKNYDEFKNYILDSRKKKDNRTQTRGRRDD